jgi:RNA polymerase sigma-70 factor (ECF subfamily)
MENIIEEIESLPPMRKAVFKMIFLEEKSTQEVAKALDISPQTVLNHKSHALNYLRNWAKGHTNLVLPLLFELLIRHH